MTNERDRYQNWSDALLSAWINTEIDFQASLFAEDCTHLSIHPFDESETLYGRDAILADFEEWSEIRGKQLLKNKILSSSPEHGIGNARVTWTGGDGRTWACDFIYQITLDSNDLCTSYQEWNVVRSKEN